MDSRSLEEEEEEEEEVEGDEVEEEKEEEGEEGEEGLQKEESPHPTANKIQVRYRFSQSSGPYIYLKCKKYDLTQRTRSAYAV